MTESFAELFEQSLTDKNMQPGAIVTGTVLEIRPDAVVVNAGLKSEGLIPLDQFFDDEGNLEVKVGDEIEVALDAIEDGFGETRLSREKAKRARIWSTLEDAYENEEKQGQRQGQFHHGLAGVVACEGPAPSCDTSTK